MSNEDSHPKRNVCIEPLHPEFAVPSKAERYFRICNNPDLISLGVTSKT